MSKRNCITKHRLGDLMSLVAACDTAEHDRIVAEHGPYRKRIWAAAHNYLNKGHPKGPRKPHKWTPK